MLELTKRQETFILNLLALYREAQEPIHYSNLAERLGVSRFTAYDMLVILEEKGFVTSEYVLPEQSKSGRSVRVFSPTKMAHRLISAITSEESANNWEAMNRRILELIESGEISNLDIGPELVARIPPEGKDKTQYCIEVVTILALYARNNEVLRTLHEFALEIIPSNDFTHRAYLSLFGGFALGALAQKAPDDADWLRELFSHVIKYQEIVLDINEDDGRRLAEGMREHVLEALALFPD